jgi:inhibitor of cysteine peptidase
MKLKWLLIGLISIALLATTACSVSAQELSVNESYSGKQVEIAKGGSLTITLESNSTTGYSWELKEIGDTSILKKIDNKYEAPTNGLIGAAGKEVWNFKALKTGKTTLNMEYSQPWEGGEKGAKIFILTVVVK